MKRDKIILITAGIMVFTGAVVSAAAMVFGSAVESDSSEIKTHTVTESISKINASSKYGDVRIIGTNTDVIKVTYGTGRFTDYKFSAENNTLSVEGVERTDSKWYDLIDFSFRRDGDSVTIEVPENMAADIITEAGYGDTEISGVSGTVDLKNSCGDIKILNSNFTDVLCEAEMGDVEIENVNAGNIIVHHDCGDIDVEDTTGNMEVYCDFGDINIERISGGRIKLENNCGDIEGTILGNEGDYKVTAHTQLGDNNLRNSSSGSKTLDVNNSSGDIDIEFVR